MIGLAGAIVDGRDDLVILATYARAPGSWWPIGAEDVLDYRCRPEPPSEAGGANTVSGLKAGGT